MSLSESTLEVIETEANRALLAALNIAPDDMEAPAKIEAHKASLGPDAWTDLRRKTRAPIQARHEAAEAAAAAEQERKRWAAFKTDAEAAILARADVDDVNRLQADATNRVRTTTAAARKSFPGDPAVAPGLFDVAEFNRGAQAAAARSANGAAAELVATPARNALALLEKLHDTAPAA